MGDIFLEFVVEDQNERRSDTSPEVRKIALEEPSHTFSLEDLASAVQCSLVDAVLGSLAALHHQSSSDGVKRVSEGFGGGSNDLCEQEALEEGSFLLFLFGAPDEAFSGVVATESYKIYPK